LAAYSNASSSLGNACGSSLKRRGCLRRSEETLKKFLDMNSWTRSTLQGTKREECKELQAKIAAVLMEVRDTVYYRD
jgi:hypothetical protein